MIKGFHLYKRSKNAIFFLDYRDTFTSALFITFFLLCLFVVTYVKAVENFISVITVVSFEKFKQGFEWKMKWIGEIFVINDNPFFF